MCDEDIHQGLIHEPAISRRAFGKAVAASAFAARTMTAAEARVVSRDVEIPMESGTADAALFYPEGKGSWPAVLVWTDILGLRPVFRDMGKRLAAEGYVVLVPNPYYRSQRAPVVSGSFDFSKPEDRAKLTPLAQTLNQETAFSDAVHFFKYLDSQKQVNTKRKAGVQGYCMGGPLTFRSAAAVNSRVGAAATFHGGGLVTDKPDSPHLLIPKMKCAVYCGVADNDDKKQPAAKDTLRESFASAHVPAKVEVYEGANHGWTVRGSQTYNEAAAERAWAELIKLYKAALA